MPHFGLIDESLSDEDAALLRARLHVRGANIRLARGDIADAVAALYDAFSTAMDLNLPETGEYRDDRTMFQDLESLGIFEANSNDDFRFIEKTLDRAIEGAVDQIDLDRFLNTVEQLLIRLCIIPFTSTSLPQAEAVTT